MIETIPQTSRAWRWSWFSYGYGIVVSAILAYFLLGLPIQFTDCFGLLLDVQELSLGEILKRYSTQRGYLRPLLWAQTRVVYVLADGEYYVWYRGLHAVQGAALILLFIRLLRPRTLLDAAVVPLGVAVLVGIHTFPGTVREAFPINTFMTILLCCVLAANLAFARHRWWIDFAAAALLAFAALTVESGLLVAVVLVSAWLAGARGLSGRGVAAVLMLLVGYFIVRFGVLGTGAPGLLERASGYGFRYYDRDELVEAFGDRRAWFYAYNIAVSALSVLFAEPRAGIWTLTRSIVEGAPRVPLLINVIASTCATLLIAAFVWRRRREWMARRFDRDDRLVLVFCTVLGANAIISYPYTKDVIMSPAGVFFAAALFVAARDFVRRLPSGATPARVALASAFCLVLTASWAIRSTGTFVALRHQVFNVRSDWTDFDQWARENEQRLANPAAIALKDRLQREAIARYPKSGPVGDWVGMFDVD